MKIRVPKLLTVDTRIDNSKPVPTSKSVLAGFNSYTKLS